MNEIYDKMKKRMFGYRLDVRRFTCGKYARSYVGNASVKFIISSLNRSNNDKNRTSWLYLTFDQMINRPRELG